MEDLPTDYDAIVVGTGLVESIYAAAAARVGKSVLHIDRNEYYSGEWAVLNFRALEEWVERHSTSPVDPTAATDAEEAEDRQRVPLHPRPVVDNVTQHWYIEEGEVEEEPPKRTYNFSVTDESAGKHPSNQSGNIEPDHSNIQAVEEGGGDAEPTMVDRSQGVSKDDESGIAVVSTDAANPDVSESLSEQQRNLPKQSSSSKTCVELSDEQSQGCSPTEEGQNCDKVEQDETESTAQKPERTSWTINRMRKLSRRFNVDLAPKVLYSRGALVELLISSNIARYAEFRAVGQLLTPLQGELQPVPSSRADVFTTRHVSVVEKRLLMKLLTFCADFDQFPEQYQAYEQRPFSEFLRSRHLTVNLTHHVIHAIAMVTPQTATAEALRSTQRFLRSLGRYGSTPFLWPMYGSGELPQCFCRMCAVFGGVYCLSRGVDAITVDQSGAVSGVTSRGQQLTCRRLLLEAAYGPRRSEARGVSRAIVFTDRSLYPASGDQILLMRLPADEVSPHPVTVLQAGAAASAAPDGLYVVHLTCVQTDTAERDLRAAVHRLRQLSATPCDETEDTGAPRAPPLSVLGAVYFNRRGGGGGAGGATAAAADAGWPDNVSLCEAPDETFDFELAVQQARALFTAHFPGEEFLPRAPDPEEIIFFDEPSPSVITGGAQPTEDSGTQLTQTQEHPEAVQSSVDHSETVQSSVDHSETVQSSVDHSETVQSSVDHSETVQSSVDHSDTVHSAAEHSDTVDSAAERPESAQRVITEAAQCDGNAETSRSSSGAAEAPLTVGSPGRA